MSRKALPFELSRDAIAQQRVDIIRTARHHGISERDTVVVGGAGLALHGLFTSVPMAAAKMPKEGLRPFDIDGVVVPGTNRWRKGLLGKDRIRYGTSADAPLPVNLKRGHAARAFAYSSFGYPDLEAMVEDSDVIDGIAVLSLRGVLESKILGNRVAPGIDRVKDRVGILGAHLIAKAENNPVADNPYWQSAVQTVMHRLDPRRADVPIMGADPMLPRWANDLRMSGFDHPAFDGMHSASDRAA